MINKYVELHEKFIDLLAKYHNNHILFISKPNVYNSRDLVKNMMQISRIVKEIKKNNLVMRKAMQEQVKARKQEIAANKKGKSK
jgi:hypothetical protein